MITVQQLIDELLQFEDREKAVVVLHGGSGLEAVVEVGGFHIIHHTTGNYVSIALMGENHNG